MTSEAAKKRHRTVVLPPLGEIRLHVVTAINSVVDRRASVRSVDAIDKAVKTFETYLIAAKIGKTRRRQGTSALRDILGSVANIDLHPGRFLRCQDEVLRSIGYHIP